MSNESKITIDTFKTVTKAIAQSDSLDIMTSHLAQLLVAALDIKGSAILVLDLETKQLEILASFGLSPKYLTKGPLKADRSLAPNLRGEPVVIPDVTKDDRVQYPAEASREGIRAMLSIPIVFLGDVLGALRLYHHETWEISAQDLESLNLLAENIALAMTYTSLRNAVASIEEVIHTGLPRNLLPDFR